MPKVLELSDIVDDHGADVVALTETWLTHDISDHELLLQASEYTFYRSERPSRNGGGVLAAVKSCLSSRKVPTNTPLEIIWISLTCAHPAILLGVCYRPPHYSPEFHTHIHDEIAGLIDRFPGHHLLLLGDFNFPHINWRTSPPTSTASDCRRSLMRVLRST